MARAPVPGHAKTRLIPHLGAEGAAALQERLCLRTLATADAAAPGAVTLFTAGHPAHALWWRCREQFQTPCIEQQGDDLGARMHHALGHLLHDAEHALLIGTDCPVLDTPQLHAADAVLTTARMVFIPAEDGGYVLVGARELCAAAFSGIAWGTPQVMQETRQALRAASWRAQEDWQELPPLWDVDTPADYHRARQLGLVE